MLIMRRKRIMMTKNLAGLVLAIIRNNNKNKTDNKGSLNQKLVDKYKKKIRTKQVRCKHLTR